MEFELMSAKHWTDSKRILKDYPQIANEFKVQIIDTTEETEYGKRLVDSEVFITINTLEDLIKLNEIVEVEIIINGDEILIYDDYIE